MFADQPDFVWLDVRGTAERIEAIALRKAYPPPF